MFHKLLLSFGTVCSSQHHRGGSQWNADESERVQEILEPGQDGRNHLGGDVHHGHSVGRGVRSDGRDILLHRKTDPVRRSSVHLFIGSSARYRALSG